MLDSMLRNAQWGRLKLLLLALFSLFLVSTLYIGYFRISPTDSLQISVPKFPGQNGKTKQGLPWPGAPEQLWSNLQPMLDGNTPIGKGPQDVKDWGTPRFDPKNDGLKMQDHITMSAGDVLNMRSQHQRFLNEMDLNLPHHLPTKNAPKRGIVTVAGGYHFPIFFVSLRMLRRTGSNLPIEVFLPTEDEYEKEVCEDILPQYNARCITLTSILNHGNGTYKPAKKLEGYQYKIFSLLFSSFEEVLFVDSDAFPIQNPDLLFESKPFEETGMVTWPDVWANSVSPLYYLISNQKPANVSERASMESGEILISKSRHHRTLVLATYYNYFGPGMFYDLLCQAGYGKGDKETFQPAASALGLPFYSVSEGVQSVGHPKHDAPDYYIFAMIQHDPAEDYDRVRYGGQATKPRPFFVHANTPKWNPKTVLDGDPPYQLTKDEGNEVPAFMGPEDDLSEIPGVERQLWEETIWVGCELEDKFRDFQAQPRRVCQRLRDYSNRVLKGRYGLDFNTGKSS